jgi:hypothetical protein
MPKEGRMADKLPLILSAKHVPEKISAEGQVVFGFEVEIVDGPRLLHLTSTAANQLKGFLNTPITT